MPGVFVPDNTWISINRRLADRYYYIFQYFVISIRDKAGLLVFSTMKWVCFSSL